MNWSELKYRTHASHEANRVSEWVSDDDKRRQRRRPCQPATATTHEHIPLRLTRSFRFVFFFFVCLCHWNFCLLLALEQRPTMATDDIASLRTEIERLARELDQASSEKIQSAQYGLGLLEEKGQLQHRCEELEALYENTKHELDITHEVSAERDQFRWLETGAATSNWYGRVMSCLIAVSLILCFLFRFSFHFALLSILLCLRVISHFLLCLFVHRRRYFMRNVSRVAVT